MPPDDPPPAPGPPPGRYGLLIRSNGWVDQFVRAEPRPPYPETDFNAWPTIDSSEAMTFETVEAARAMAEVLNPRFGDQRYTFTVIERRLVPRWFILEPQRDHEKRPVGSCEQL